MINIGIIGYGMSAKTFHEPFIRVHNTFKLHAIASSKPSDELPEDVQHYHDAEHLLADEQIDAVVVCAPTAHHFSLGQSVLNTKKHLILEKPMTTTLKEAHTLTALANKQAKILAVFHNRRFTGDFQTVKQLIKQEKLGNMHHAEIHIDRFRPVVRDRWRENAGAGSGILYDLGSHLIDQALQLFGTPESLTARSIAVRPTSPSVDYFHIQLHYPQLEVILHSSPYHSAPNPMYRIEGEKGTFIKYGIDPQEAQAQSGVSPLDAKFACEPSSQHGTFYNAKGEAEIIPTERSTYLEFYDNFAKTIEGESPLIIAPEEASNVVKLIKLAQQSSDMKKTITYT